MRFSRLSVIFGIFAIAIPTAPANRTPATAPLLTEVEKHLEDAKRCISEKTFQLAIHHADMVLVDQSPTYAVKFESVPEKIRPNAVKAMEEALAIWEEAIPGTIDFKRTEDEAAADIVIRFKPDVRMGREPVAGYANWKRVINTDELGNISSKFSADLQIRTMGLDWSAMPLAAMRHEIMHEVGHVLGLEDCDDPGSIMGPLDVSKPVARPRPHEVKAVFELRIEATRIRTEAASHITS